MAPPPDRPVAGEVYDTREIVMRLGRDRRSGRLRAAAVAALLLVLLGGGLALATWRLRAAPEAAPQATAAAAAAPRPAATYDAQPDPADASPSPSPSPPASAAGAEHPRPRPGADHGLPGGGAAPTPAAPAPASGAPAPGIMAPPRPMPTLEGDVAAAVKVPLRVVCPRPPLVWLDGRKVGRARRIDMSLMPGPHLVQARCGRRVARQALTIVPGVVPGPLVLRP